MHANIWSNPERARAQLRLRIYGDHGHHFAPDKDGEGAICATLSDLFHDPQQENWDVRIWVGQATSQQSVWGPVGHCR